MPGTAILFMNEHNYKVVEDVDRKIAEEMKKMCGCDQCTCFISNKKVNYGSVSQVMWKDDIIDFEYGY